MTDLESSGAVVWPKWCYSSLVTDKKTALYGGAPSPPAKSRRKRAAEPVSQLQRETETPDRSPSVSPGSLRSESSPQERRSPATPVSAPAQFLPPPRNYSDFIRSLAAKYNNNNPNEYFAYQNNNNNHMPVRGLDYSRLGLKPGVGVPPASSQQSQQKGGAAGDRKEPLAGTSPLLAVHPHLAAFSGLPMLDVLSMVRPGLAAAPYLASPPLKRTQDGAPLDLSNIKRPRLEKGFKELFGLKEEESRPAVQPPSQQHVSVCTQKPCSPEAELVLRWSVEDVVSFVQSVDICAEYAQTFREHRIDGRSLPLLNAEHLTNILKLKLGPALRLRSELSKKLGQCGICLHCNHCHGRQVEPSRASPHH